MLNNRNKLSKKYIVIGLTIIVLAALASYKYTGNFLSGFSPMVEEEIVKTANEKINRLLNGSQSVIEEIKVK